MAATVKKYVVPLVRLDTVAVTPLTPLCTGVAPSPPAEVP
jgi:hypothetical protein